jgi:hypothetical protein
MWTVQKVLAALEELDIHMVDVSPTNIAFVEDSRSSHEV